MLRHILLICLCSICVNIDVHFGRYKCIKCNNTVKHERYAAFRIQRNLATVINNRKGCINIVCCNRTHTSTVMYWVLILLISNIIYCNGRLKYRNWFDEFDLILTEHFNHTRPIEQSKVLRRMCLMDGLLSVYARRALADHPYVKKIVRDIYESTPFKGPTFIHCDFDKRRLSKLYGMTDINVMEVQSLREEIRSLWDKLLDIVYKRIYHVNYLDDKLVSLGVDF